MMKKYLFLAFAPAFPIILYSFFLIHSAHAQDITSGLIGHWKFDETSGTTATDSSGNNNTGTLTNGPVWTTGKIGGAVSFDGVDDFIDVSGFNQTLASATFFAWINRRESVDWAGIVFSRGTGVSGMNMNGGSGTVGYHWDADPNTYGWNSTLAVPLNQWALVAVVVEPTKATLYLGVNGAVNSSVNAVSHGPSTINALKIGRDTDFRNFPGAIDDVRIYSRALTASDIQTIYTIGNGTPLPTVSITAPTSGSTVSGSSVIVSANASDNVGVAGVQFKLDGVNLGAEDTNAPYSITWNTTTVSNGSHTLTATTRDTAGNTTTSSGITVTVSNTTSDTQAPSTPTGLSATAQPSSQINLSWTASTDNVGVTGYRAERCQGSTCTNFAQIGTPSASSYSDTGLSANTTYRYQVRATDAAGNLSVYSSIASGTTQSAPIGGTALANLAANMAPGTFAELSTNGFSRSFLQTGTVAWIGSYADHAVWDPTSRRLFFLGAGHYEPWKFIMYDDTTNAWSSGPLPLSCMAIGGACIGHAYDHNAVNPSTGEIYHRPYNSRDVYRYISGGWSLYTSIPTSVMESLGNTGALQYFPELEGLVYIQGANSNPTLPLGGAYFFNTSTNQWSKLAEPLVMGPYHNEMEYSVKAKVMIFGGGNNSRDVYKINAAGTVTKMQNAPVDFGIQNTFLTVDPVSGKFLLFGPSANKFVYEYDAIADTWKLLNMTVPFDCTDNCLVVAPISTYGVVMFLKYPDGKIYLYKHSASSPPPSDTTVPTASVTAPSAGTTVANTVTMTATASDNVGVTNVEFLVDGVVKGSDISSPYSYSWDTTNGGTHPCNGVHTHTLVTRAYDAAGNVGTSANIVVNMNNPSYCTTPPPSSKFVIGDRVQVSSGPLNVRSTPSISGTLLGTQATNALGTVTGGPTAADGYNWWNINYDTGVDGWSVEDFLVKYTPPSDTTPPTTPTNLSAIAISSSQISLSWNASTDNVGITGYRIYRGGSQITTVTGTSHSDTGLSPSTAYSYAVAAYDAAGNVSAQSSSASATTQSSPPPPPPPPPPSAGNTVTIYDTSGSIQTNRPVSISRPFKQGDIPQFASASVNGTPVLTQTDVKNRWPDGSLKFAIVSFVIPNLPANGSVTIAFSNQSTGNNTGYLTQAQLLDPAYDFEGTIQMTGATAQTVSARQMIQNSHFRYWLQGPVVTAVIIEDRTLARTYDKDFGDGSKALHPIYEAWFYPQNKKVELGYTMENTWASSNIIKSMRDLSYSVELRSGSASPTVEFIHPTFNHIGRSRWHKTFWLGMDPQSIRVDHNIRYLVTTKTIPNYDTGVIPAETLIQSNYNSWLNAPKSFTGNGTYLGNYGYGLGTAGSNPWLGLMNTWDTLYLLTMDDRMLEKSLGNADLAGRIPYNFREADTAAGSGDFFDAPTTGSVDTFGRPVSINARKTETLGDLPISCGPATDDINTGTITDGGFGGYNLGRHHMPDIGYIPYLITGQYYYLEQLQLQAAYIVGWKIGCYGGTYQRQGEAGYFNETEHRGNAWSYRTLAYAAFISPDSAPEKSYFEDKLANNIAKDEGRNGLSQSYSAKSSHYTWGSVNQKFPTGPSPLGFWDYGPQPYPCENPVIATLANSCTSPWVENFVVAALGMARDFGYPTDNLLKFEAKRIFNQLLSPLTSPYLIEAYRNATIVKATQDWIRNWSDFNTYHTVPSGWSINGDVDHGYGFIALGASSFLYPYTVDGYTGQQAWNFFKAAKPEQNKFATESPKWAILPRTSGTTSPPNPLIGDLNQDGTVNSFDWSIMAGVWFTADATADLNKDGIVNSIDFSLLNRNWGKTQ